MNNTFLSRLGAHGAFVIANETFYQVCEKREGASYDNLMLCNGLELALVPSGSLQELERFERSSRRQENFDYKKKFVQNTLQRELMSDKDIKNYDDVKCALKYILEEFLPLMIDTAYEMGELLGVPNVQGVKTGRQVIDDLVQEELALMETEDPAERIKILKAIVGKKIKPSEQILRWEDTFTDPKPNYNGNTSTLGAFTDQTPLYFSRGIVATLTPKEDGDVVLVINGKKYSLGNHITIQHFDAKYAEETAKSLEREALDDFDAQFEQLSIDLKKEKGFNAFASKPSFSYGNLGYIRQGDAFYVYWEVPKFAMQNPVKPHLCNPYPATKVALRIHASGGQIFRSEHAYAIDPMIHPTLEDWKNPFAHICTLSGKFRGNEAKNAMADLSDGINSFINGLTMQSLIVHGSGDDDCRFYNRPLRRILEKVGYLKLEDAMAQGYKITNVWYHDEYNQALAKFKGEKIIPKNLEEAVKNIPIPDATKTAQATPIRETPIEQNRFRRYYERAGDTLRYCGRKIKNKTFDAIDRIFDFIENMI